MDFFSSSSVGTVVQHLENLAMNSLGSTVPTDNLVSMIHWFGVQPNFKMWEQMTWQTFGALFNIWHNTEL